MAAIFTQKYAACILFALMAAISMPKIANAGYTMKETCAYLYAGYIADPTNCQNWGYCSGGELVAAGSCDKGFLYDSSTGICNYAKDVTCTSTVENACTNLADPGMLANPNNCNQYCYCTNGVISGCGNCPQNQIYDSNTNQCIWSTDGTCGADSICRLVQNNQFVGDPLLCGNYIRCVDGAGTSAQCPTGKFNPLKNGCDPNYTSCTNSPGVPSTPSGPVLPPATNATVCAQYPTTATGTQYFTDYTSCYGYYACESATSNGIWGSCPWATHFNGKECVTPYAYACPLDRCGNLNLGFVAELGCKSYSVCKDQVTVATGSCAKSNPNFAYLNEAEGACVGGSTPPTQEICTATAYAKL